MKRAFASIATAALLVGLAIAPAAGAATEFGSSCSATGFEGELVFTDLSHNPSEPLAATAPVGGVVTQVKSSIGIDLPVEPITLTAQVYRPAGVNRFTLVGQSSPATIVKGANSFATRIPIQAGDHIGFLGQYGAFVIGFFCETGLPGDVMAYTPQRPPLGGSESFETADGYRAPIAAVIEPDGDNDGYGDESQDGCPQSAAFQTACPLVDLDLTALTGKGSAVVYVAGSTEGTVSLKAVVPLGKGKKATLKAGPKTVAPGKIVPFKLKFSAKLKKRLQELEPSKKLTLKITASATNVAGQISTDTAKAKLKGQG